MFKRIFGSKPITDDDVLQGNILKNITSISGYVSDGFLKKVKNDLVGILDAIRNLKKDRDFYKKTSALANEKSITPTQVEARIEQMNEIHGDEMFKFNKDLANLRTQIIELDDANKKLKQVNDDLIKNKSSEPGYNDELTNERNYLQQEIDILKQSLQNQKGVVLQSCSEKLTVIDKKLSATVALFENYKNELDAIINQIQTELNIEEPMSSAEALKTLFQPQPQAVALNDDISNDGSDDNPLNGLTSQLKSNAQPARGPDQPPPPPAQNNGFEESKERIGGYNYSASNKINKKSIKSKSNKSKSNKSKSARHRKKHKGNKKTRR